MPCGHAAMLQCAGQGAREDLRVVSDPGRVLLSPSHRVHARSLASSLPSADREDRFDFFQKKQQLRFALSTKTS